VSLAGYGFVKEGEAKGNEAHDPVDRDSSKDSLSNQMVGLRKSAYKEFLKGPPPLGPHSHKAQTIVAPNIQPGSLDAPSSLQMGRQWHGIFERQTV